MARLSWPGWLVSLHIVTIICTRSGEAVATVLRSDLLKAKVLASVVERPMSVQIRGSQVVRGHRSHLFQSGPRGWTSLAAQHIARIDATVTSLLNVVTV